MLDCAFNLYNEKSLRNPFVNRSRLVVHRGAWAMPDDMVEAHLHGVRNACGVLARARSAALDDATLLASPLNHLSFPL
jgi:hypothetical protein